MSNSIFQMVYQNRIETFFEQTTLEECTDVTYTEQDIQDEFNGGMPIPYSGTSDSIMIKTITGNWSDKSRTISLINLPELCKSVKQQLEKAKDATIETSEWDFQRLNKDCFKPQGFMFKPSTCTFVKYKAPKKKYVISKALINQMRNATVGTVERFAQNKFGIHIELKYCNDKESHAKCVKFGLDIGLSLKQMEEQSGYRWSTYDCATEKYIDCFQSVRELVTETLTTKGEACMIEPTIQEYKNWLKSSSQLKTS